MPPRKVKPCPQQVITDCGGKYYYDKKAGWRIVKFFENILRHTTGSFAGKLFKLLPWQRDQFIMPLFAWKRKSDGLRRFRKAFVEIPKKNGKTSVCAGIGLYLTGADREVGAKVYCAATEREQARLVFDSAGDMLDLSPGLNRFYKRGVHAIVVPTLKASFSPVSKETKGRHGINAHGVVFDELHALKDPELYEVMTRGSTASRRQPLQVTITTAGHDRNSICWDEYQHALEVLEDETIDEQMLVVIYAADEKDDWTDPEVWKKANPSLGVTISEEYLHEECELAKKQPRYENTFKRLHLDMWTSQVTRWISKQDWDKCGEKFGIEFLKNKLCYGGLDLSSTIDITALCLVFPTPDKIFLWPQMFIPQDRITDAEKRDRVPYSRWVAQGYLIATPGNVVDYEFIESRAEEAKAMFSLQEIGYDPYNATMIVQRCEKKGIKMCPVSQNFSSISQPTKEFERLLISGKLRHPKNPVLDWMADNIEVRTGPNGVIAPNKPEEKAGKQKRIDGIVGGIIAIERVMRAPEVKESIYRTRGIRTL